MGFSEKRFDMLYTIDMSRIPRQVLEQFVWDELFSAMQTDYSVEEFEEIIEPLREAMVSHALRDCPAEK